jgi:hypothetical protein
MMKDFLVARPKAFQIFSNNYCKVNNKSSSAILQESRAGLGNKIFKFDVFFVFI